MKIAIVHYWLVGMRGGEAVLEEICRIFPDADIFTNVFVPSAVSDTIRNRNVFTTFIQQLPAAARWYQSYLPLMPLALQQLDLRGYDLVISSESGPAKGVVVDPDARHICYCHTPMRYLWDMYHSYAKSAGMLKRILMPPIVHYLRQWDYMTSAGVDRFIANSRFTAQRIARCYRRASDIVHPPVPVQEFQISQSIDDFYLFLGQLTPYKRPDLAIDAFNANGRKLVVIGEGELFRSLRKRAKRNISFLGRQPIDCVKDHLSRCRAVIFPGIEDFGIVPVESMASGRPVIALGRGGALDTVIDGTTGVLFPEQDVDSLSKAIEKFERIEANFDPESLLRHARSFDSSVFTKKFRAIINNEIKD